MSDVQLLQIVEVPKSDRVFCQAPGSKHTVFKRIHIVLHDGILKVFGSDCFQQLFGSVQYVPRYGTSSGISRLLTPEERQMLVENTATLIAKFEKEHLAEQEKARLLAEQQAALEQERLVAQQQSELEHARFIAEQNVILESTQHEQQKRFSLDRVSGATRTAIQPKVLQTEPVAPEPMWRASFPTRDKLDSALHALAARTGLSQGRLEDVIYSVSSRGQLSKTTPLELASKWADALCLPETEIITFFTESGFIF